jgi:hypothetical protein
VRSPVSPPEPLVTDWLIFSASSCRRAPLFEFGQRFRESERLRSRFRIQALRYQVFALVTDVPLGG